jgi:hypothetical protein
VKTSAQARVEQTGRRGAPLPDATRAAMEDKLGHDMGAVRVHTDARAADTAEALGARAVTAGEDVFLNRGQYAPETPVGRQLLGHELAHVVQQRNAAAATPPAGARQESAATMAAAGRTAALSPGTAVGAQRAAMKGEGEGEVKPAGAATTTGAKKKEKKEESPGFFDRVWSGIKAAGGAVWDGLKAAGEFVWGGLKTAGEWVWGGLKKLGGWIKTGAEAVWAAIKWVGRQLWDKITGVFARIAHWVTQLPRRVGRLFAGLWEGLLTLKPWSLAWWKSLLKADTWLGLLKWLGARLVDVLEIMGIGELYETAMDFVKFNTRKLTGDEIKLASSVFGSSINYELVRVDERALLGPSWTKRAYVSFHVINDWGHIKADTLLHELTHVWQYEQDGAIYMPQAIHAQAWGEGYTYKGAAGLRNAQTNGLGFRDFNREQQGQIVQDFYLLKTTGKTMDPGQNPASAADLPLYASFVVAVSTLSEAQLLAK